LNSLAKLSRGEDQWKYWSTFVACWGKKADGLKPHWYGFDDPFELRNLIRTLEEGSGSSGKASAGGMDSLVKSLLSLADFLEDRMEG
jgi:hypothetical protein